MAGPNSPQGAIRPHGVWNTDLLDPILPAAPAWLSSGVSPLPRIMDIDPAELGAYIGAPALVAAVLIVACFGRRSVHKVPVRIAGATGFLVFLLALGSPILLGGRVLFEIGPFGLIEAIPMLNNILPMRLVLHSTIALFAALGIGLQWALSHWKLRRARALLVLLVLAAVAVLPGPQTAHEVTVPSFYEDSIAEVVPAGSVVKTFPRPLAWAEPHADEAMVWQSVSGFRYRETGGYFIGSSPESPVTYSAPEDALDELLLAPSSTGNPCRTQTVRKSLRQLLSCGRPESISSSSPRMPRSCREMMENMRNSSIPPSVIRSSPTRECGSTSWVSRMNPC